jgi:hypothetical protein
VSSPLDRIEARWLKNAEINPARFDGPRRRIAELTLREAQDVLALVNVAKAAERVLNEAPYLDGPEKELLREALAALDKDPA